MSWPLFFTINSTECVRRGQGQRGNPEAPVSARNVYMWSRRGEENCRFPLLGVNIGLAVVAYRHGCVLVCVCVKLCCLPISISFCFASFPAHKQFTQEQIHTHTHTQAHHCTARHMANSLSPRLPPTMQAFTAGVNIFLLLLLPLLLCSCNVTLC